MLTAFGQPEATPGGPTRALTEFGPINTAENAGTEKGSPCEIFPDGAVDPARVVRAWREQVDSHQPAFTKVVIGALRTPYCDQMK